MASGGYQPTKQGRSEPQRQTNWQRSFSSDRDDAHSLNSLPGDMLINNWDLSDLHPSNLGMNSKRHKKSKGNPEREREQSLSVESPPNEKKHHTPSTYPRTQMTANTPASQRAALENIRLHMTFSDAEDDQANIDGERNNERQVKQKPRVLPNGSLNRASSEDSIRASLGLFNQNNNMHRSSKEQGLDRNEIVARLTQIRDFMKQSRSMLESLERLGNKKRTEDVEKVRRLIRNLQEQEQGYKGLLQNSMKLPHNEDVEDDDDEEDETAGDDGDDDDDDDNDDDGDDKVVDVEAMECSDNSSVDLDVQTEFTEASQDSQPQIKLDIESDGDEKDEDVLDVMFVGAGRESADVNLSGLTESDHAEVVHSGVHDQETQEGARGATAIDGEVLSDTHRDLLQILKEKEQQLQALMSRQEELNTLRKAATKKLMVVKARDNIANTSLAALSASRQFLESRPHTIQELETAMRGAGMGINEEDELSRAAVGQDRQLKSNIVGYPESDDEDNSKVLSVEVLPNKLLELKRQLNYLKNEFFQIREDPNNMESDGLAEGQQQQQQLQNKLLELQNKKLLLDMRLQELQLIHSPLGDNHKNNEANSQANDTHAAGLAVPHIPAPLQQNQQTSEKPAVRHETSAVTHPANLQAQANALASFADLSGWLDFGQDLGAHMMPGMLEGLQEKLRHLKEVQEQLNHLQSAAQLNEVRQEIVANGDDSQPALGSRNGGNHGSQHTLANTEAQAGSSSSLQVQANQQSQSLKQHSQQRQKQRSQQQQRQQPQVQQKQQPQVQQKQQPQAQKRQQPQAQKKQQPQAQQKQQPQTQQKQHQSQQKLKPTANHFPKQQTRDRPDGIAATAAARNMTQLLNLEVTDPGDEHSDEDNVSASKSESVWSEFESWDHDPEVQEKVRKLKFAKEKLRQLQDLVAFVQQSPDGAGLVPEEQAGTAASVDGEAISHATQTDHLNVSVSEGELPSESLRIPHRDDGGGEIEDPEEELEKLRNERTMLLEIQNQLQRIQSQASGAQAGQVQDRSGQNADRDKSGQDQTSSTTVVTFASNDELYSKIRRQRILHEELRSKKKELEAIMKKDHNRKQYSRNQDNQSDSVSLTTDTFGLAASVDATMATWGGSTADNLENITEDEDGQERNNSVDREEDNEDDDVESPPRNRSNSRNVQRRPDLSSRQENHRRPQERRQDNEAFTGQNVDWFRGMESRLSGLTSAVEALLKKSEMEGRQLHVSVNQDNMPHSSTGLLPPRQDLQLLQLQNQSLMLSLGQLVQTVTCQHGDIQHLQHQVQALQIQIQAVGLENMPPAVGVGLPNPFRQPQASPAVSTSSSRTRAAAAVGIHPVVINHHQIPSLYTQRNANNTNLFGGHSTASSGLPSLQSGSLSLPARHLPQGADKTPADGACSQPQSLPHQGQPGTGKSGTQVKKSYSDSASGVRMPESLGEGRSRVYPIQGDDGHTDSRTSARDDYARAGDFDHGGSGYCSSQSVSSQCSRLRRVQAPARPTDSGAAVANSSTLFDTLRDTIYTEVASLISQNENRPYFLLELFRDMQRVDSDFMRQRALNLLQELLHSGHRKKAAASSSSPSWSRATQTHTDTARSGLTSSKNLTEEEEDDDLTEPCLPGEVTRTERGRLETVTRSATLQNQPFDRAELEDSASWLSTPANGDDETLTFQRYLPTKQRARGERRTRNPKERTEKRSSTSESRKNPHITELLSQRARSMMAAIIPFVKEHMGDVCSVQLLNYIVRLVVSSTSQMGDEESVVLFQQQLTSVLENTLLKYQDRRMRDCGEDLVLDISGVLFNQLAYFGFVQNLDDRVVTGQVKPTDRTVQIIKSDNTSEHTAIGRTSAGTDDKIDDMNKYDENASRLLEDRNCSSGFRTILSEQATLINGQKFTATEKSELENDDDDDDDEDGGESEQSYNDAGVLDHSYTIELSHSETKPFARIGSDEDDDEGDEVWSINDPSETAVSRDTMLENSIPQHPLAPPPPTRPEAEGAQEDGSDIQNLGQSRLSRHVTRSRADEVDGPSGGMYHTVADVLQVNIGQTNNHCEEQPQASLGEKLPPPAALPDSTTRSDSVVHRGKYEEEQSSLNGLDAVLASLGGMEELAGDESWVIGPDLFTNCSVTSADD